MVVRQGDVVWLNLPRPTGSGPGGRRPAIVLQHDRFNRSRIQTAVVAPVTSTLKLGEAPGNLRLRKREGGLARPSVVNVSQLVAVDLDRVGPRIGRLTPRRLAELWRGVRLLLEPAPEVLALLGEA